MPKKESKPNTEKAVLVGIVHKDQSEDALQEFLHELRFLVETAGGQTVKQIIQKLNTPNPATFIGKGKIMELYNYVKSNDIDMVIFDDELSPSQIKNIERIFNPKPLENGKNVKIMDRTNLILDIFAQRALTSHARTQVELAQYQYLLPRLTGMWTHLERQKGGIGLRGPGESQIETDRRIIQDKIALLKNKLYKIDKQMATQRKARGKLVRVALVGYTNVGKSTIMNALSRAQVFAENKLFATLDTTVRKVVIDNLPFLLSDTVGFIRKLPTQLVESFKSTLDETRESDLLLHVVDISHPQMEEQQAIVQKTLMEIGVSNKPSILVLNKVDAFKNPDNDPFDLPENRQMTLNNLKKIYQNKLGSHCIFISASKKTNWQAFKKLLYVTISEIHKKRYPYNSYLY